MENRHQPLEQHRIALRKGRQAHPLTAASTNLRGNNISVRHSPIRGVTLDTRLAWPPLIERVKKNSCPKTGSIMSSPKHLKWSSVL
jgi:hypothetical protein